jgi:hypothetical protein
MVVICLKTLSRHPPGVSYENLRIVRNQKESQTWYPQMNSRALLLHQSARSETVEKQLKLRYMGRDPNPWLLKYEQATTQKRSVCDRWVNNSWTQACTDHLIHVGPLTELHERK